MTSNAYKKKKQPEQVRQAILDAVVNINFEQGLSQVTIQAVASAVGVTKGGVLHHFPSRQVLLETASNNALAYLEDEIREHLDPDPAAIGRFTRAYISAVLSVDASGMAENVFALALMQDPQLGSMWRDWMSVRLSDHAATDTGVPLEILRLAADGAWLAAATTRDVSDIGVIRAALLDMAEEP